MRHLPFIFAIVVMGAFFAFCVVKCPGVNEVGRKVRTDVLSAGPGGNTLDSPLRFYGTMGEGIDVGEVGKGPYLSLPEGVELNLLGL